MFMLSMGSHFQSNAGRYWPWSENLGREKPQRDYALSGRNLKLLAILITHFTDEGRKMHEDLIAAITTFSREDAFRITLELLEKGTSPQEIFDASRSAMQTVGDLFEDGQYFLPELVIAGDILAGIAERVKPFLKGDAAIKTIGKVVIGTVEGDIHDIAKDIVVTMLEVNGFEIIDLGVDVSPDVFVEAVRAHQIQVVGLSGFLTLAIEPMRRTIVALKDAGFTDVKIMIGGGPINEMVCKDVGADGWGKDAMEEVSLAKDWTAGA
jgi:methanogenic corrinoid protein MtbC1